MKKDHLAFLIAGIAFGFLLGFGLFRAIASRPGQEGGTVASQDEIPSPAGPSAPTQTVGDGSGAPMMAEINALKERVQKDPSDVQAWTRLANLFQDAGMYAPAIEIYQRAIKLKPNDANLLTDVGICYQETKQFDLALDHLERAQKADPSNWQSLYNIVVVAGLQLKKFDQAHAALAKLQQIRPDAPNLAQLRDALAQAQAR